MLSQPLIMGSTYRIKFKSIFERHGVCTTPGLTCLHKGGGVFRLEQIASFRDIVQAGIKLYEVFFQPLGISEDDYFKYFDGKPDDEYKPEMSTKLVSTESENKEYVSGGGEGGGVQVITHKVISSHEVYAETGNSVVKRHVADSVNYAAYPIYKFVDVVDPLDVVYVPELTIDGFPEIDIAEYKDLSLVFRIGYIDKTDKLDPMMLAIRERLAVYGMNPSQIRLYSTGSKWLNHEEYEAIKLLREPAEIVKIDAKDADSYLNKFAISDGELKKIVVPDEHGKVEDGQISINALVTRDQIIDNQLFLVQCKPGEKYTPNGTYFRQETRTIDHNEALCFVRLEEMRDYSPGSDILTYHLTTAADIAANAPAYKEVDGPYIKVAPERDRTSIPLDTLFVKKIVTVDDVETVTYENATPEDVADVNRVLYTQGSSTYEVTAPAVEGVTYAADAIIWRENPATVQALELMGCKFVYVDDYQVERSMTLELADIVDLAASVKGVTLPATFNAADPSAWQQYLGRKFRYEEVRAGSPDTSLTDTIEVRIDTSSANFLCGKSGVILGYQGQISRETLVTDPSSMGNNYFMKYQLERKENDALKIRLAALEDAVFNGARTQPSS